MRSIYRSPQAKEAVLTLYDEQMQDLQIPYEDLYVNTSFGRTHVIECGNKDGKSLLVLHGGNVTTAYNLQACAFLLDRFHIFAPDTIGQPGKSAETSLSAWNSDYGEWATEVIEGLGFPSMACLGGSFGAGILVKAMSFAPDLVERAVLLVPSAIRNAAGPVLLRMAVPLLLYQLTGREDLFDRALRTISEDESSITEEMTETARVSLDCAKLRSLMPRNESARSMRQYQNPVLVMAAEKDNLFPGEEVLRRAKEVWPQSYRYLLRDRGHIHTMTDEEKSMIITFLLR